MTKLIDLTTQTMGAANPFQTRKESQITHIARHHSATATGDQFVFENHWKTLGWRNGGYHEIILRDGTVQLCYVPTVVSNGVANHNSYIYNICLVGNGSFTEEQEKAFEERAKVAMKRFNIPVANVVGHNEFSGTATSCPGTDMSKVRGRLSGSADSANNNNSNNTNSSNNSNTSNTANNTVGLVDWMKSQGMDSSFSNRAKLAQQHGINGYAGTATQNTQLLNILRNQPSTPAPTAPTTQFYATPNNRNLGLVDALKSINVDSSFTNRQRIAVANGIRNYTGTASQNNQMVGLLNSSLLVRP